MAKTKVSEEEIDALLDAAEWDHAVFWGKELVMSFRLACGFTVTGRSACVCPENFDLEFGKVLARADAKRQLWALEGYRLQWGLSLRGSDAFPIAEDNLSN